MLGQTISHYTILKELGRGGSARVYLARDEELHRQVALKLLNEGRDQTARDRLLKEVRASAALDHPFICKVHEVGESGGKHFIVMEYVEGTTLADRLKEGPFALQDALRIARNVGEGPARPLSARGGDSGQPGPASRGYRSDSSSPLRGRRGNQATGLAASGLSPGCCWPHRNRPGGTPLLFQQLTGECGPKVHCRPSL